MIYLIGAIIVIDVIAALFIYTAIAAGMFESIKKLRRRLSSEQ